jgi:hypothetical protein
MAKHRTKPNYEHELGAYSTAPNTEETSDGRYEAKGDIECWRGSVGDLSRAAQEVVESLAENTTDPATVSVSCTDSTGRHRRYDSLEEFGASASQVPDDDLSTLRIEIRKDATDTAGAIVARRVMPGVLIHASGRNRIEVDGFARLLFRRLMPGYIDRYGGMWRWLTAVAITLVPAALFYGIAADRWDNWPHALSILVGIIGVPVTFWVMVHSWQWTLYRTPVEFVPDEAPPGADWRGSIENFFRRSWVAKALALVGILALGVITNKISELIPWP